MKTVYFLIALGCALLLDFSAVADPITGPVELNINAVSQNLDKQAIIDKTNIVKGIPVVTTAYRSDTTNFTKNASSLLNLLANSYNTNFPAGTQLLLCDSGNGVYQFAISDQTGTNISFFPSVLQTTFSPAVISAVGTETFTNFVSANGSYTATVRSALVFTYDDSAMTTRDGKKIKFTRMGFALSKQSEKPISSPLNESVTMSLTGGSDSFRGMSSVIFSGTLRAKVSGD